MKERGESEVQTTLTLVTSPDTVVDSALRTFIFISALFPWRHISTTLMTTRMRDGKTYRIPKYVISIATRIKDRLVRLFRGMW
ncbi:hypothetical protein V1477_018027 [Vespula maculifrons]|uniref:Uncharacterized protein n=1 Tax=Vespula maculifrons TaxID=7453 RepID=A0ABD2B018_VESMC